MTSSYAPSLYGTDIVTGQGITNMIAQILQQAAANQNNLFNTAGYYDPYTLGGGNMQPTLQRELGMGNLGLGFAGLGLNRELGFGDLALGRDQLNYNQRLGEKGMQLDALGLLSSQRGPENYLAYNYLLNSMGTPEGMPADISQFTQGLNQPSTAGQQQAAPQSTEIPYDNGPVSHQGQETPTPQMNSAPRNMLYDAGRGGQGNMTATSGVRLADGTNLMVDQNRFDTDPNYLKLIEQAVTSGKRVPGLAQGGQTQAPLLQVGDEQSGQPNATSELITNPTGAPIGVLPAEAMPPGMDAEKAAQPGPEEVLMMIFSLLQSVMGDEGGQPGMEQGSQQPPMGGQPPLVAAPTGGMFGGTVYSPETIAAAPAVKKFTGEAPSRLFGGTNLDTTLPGTSTNLGSNFNMRNFMELLPSEQGFMQGLYETPRGQGGLGLDFRDVLAQSMRAAPTGQRFAPASYGG